MMEQKMPFLRLEHITKDFSGTTVLQDVSFSVFPGEIVALVGENGAGKTTLMSILFGMPVISQTGGCGGKIFINEKEVNFKSPFDALDAGIGMVHQEFSLIPGFTAVENIMLNRELTKRNVMADIFGPRMSVLDNLSMKKRAEGAISRLGVTIDSSMRVSEMPVGHKQFTEIAREIDRENVQLLVLDEPTAVLTESEAEILLDSIKRLSQKGIAIIFISHRLREVTHLSDRVIILRDGRSIRDVAVSETSVEDIAASMVGRQIKSAVHRERRELKKEVVLSVERLWVDMPGETVRDANFEVTRGEIFGIGGLAGQGKLGIPNGIMSLYASGGSVRVHGKQLELGNPRSALCSSVAFVSEDRRGVGLLLDETLEWNIAFTAMQTKNMFLRSFLGGLIKLRDEGAMQALAQKYISLLEIKCTGPKQRSKELSGGNQQKICLARAFCLKPDILFVSEPTRGIDVGAKAIVLDVLRKYNREQGTTIIMVSSELEELRSICDRVAIVADGTIAGILSPEEKPAEFALYMSGVKSDTGLSVAVSAEKRGSA